jgi:hypothetical protein
MTDLSSAADAVLNAIKSELDHAPWELSYLAGSSAAAALRAAADQLYDSASQDYLWKLANELEHIND